MHVSWSFQWLGKLLDQRYIVRSSADENHGDCNRGRLSRLLRSLQVKGVYCRRARSNSDKIESAFLKICHVLFPHWLRPAQSPCGNCIPALMKVYIIEWPLLVMESVLESRPPDIQWWWTHCVTAIISNLWRYLTRVDVNGYTYWHCLLRKTDTKKTRVEVNYHLNFSC